MTFDPADLLPCFLQLGQAAVLGRLARAAHADASCRVAVAPDASRRKESGKPVMAAPARRGLHRLVSEMVAADR